MYRQQETIFEQQPMVYQQQTQRRSMSSVNIQESRRSEPNYSREIMYNLGPDMPLIRLPRNFNSNENIQYSRNNSNFERKPIFSAPLNHTTANNRRNKHASNILLNIHEISQDYVTVDGGIPLIILTDPIVDNNIEIRFFEPNMRNEVVWESVVPLKTSDIHKNCAVYCKSPPYYTQNLDQPKNIYLQISSSGHTLSLPKCIEMRPCPQVNRTAVRKRPKILSNCNLDSEKHQVANTILRSFPNISAKENFDNSLFNKFPSDILKKMCDALDQNTMGPDGPALIPLKTKVSQSNNNNIKKEVKGSEAPSISHKGRRSTSRSAVELLSCDDETLSRLPEPMIPLPVNSSSNRMILSENLNNKSSCVSSTSLL